MASVGWSCWGRILCVGLLLALAAAAAVAQEDAVQARRAAMKANGQALMHIDKIIRGGGKPADVVEPAMKIAARAVQIPDLFPPGSGAGDAAADPSIWKKFDDFQGKAANLQSQASMLAAAAQAGDLATVRAQFDKVVQACSACHKPYRHQRW